MMRDEYHPHFPAVDKDHHERLCDNAAKMANPFRLMCRLYTPREEARLAEFYAARQTSEYGPRAKSR